jgi:hypothetical protein
MLPNKDVFGSSLLKNKSGEAIAILEIKQKHLKKKASY